MFASLDAEELERVLAAVLEPGRSGRGLRIAATVAAITSRVSSASRQVGGPASPCGHSASTTRPA